jgi:hypothetical protein
MLRSLEAFDRSCSSVLHTAEFPVFDVLLVAPGMLFGTYVMPFTLLVILLTRGYRAGALAIAST